MKRPAGRRAALVRLLLAALCSAASAWSAEEPGSAPPDTSDPAALHAELARRGAILERLEGQSAPPAPALRWSGYLQVDWVVHNRASADELNLSTGAPLNQDRFLLRRGHLRLDAEHGLLSGALEIDANTLNGPQLRPIDAEVSLRWPEARDARTPWVSLSAGLMKIPFGFEVPELDVERPFLERSTVARALFPGEFDLGARLSAQYRFVALSVAVMNGHPLGEQGFPGLAPDQRHELVGRLGTHHELGRVVLDVGVSADAGRGFHAGTPTTKDELVWRDDNGDGIVQATEVQVIGGSAATPSQTFERFALGGDARLSVCIAPAYELSLRAEVMRGKNLDRAVEPADPIGAGYDLRELGWYLGATQELTHWALVGVRYDRYDPDQDAREGVAANVVPRDRSYSTWGFLAMLRYHEARLSAEYDWRHNALGRSASGAPTTLPDDALTLRAQIRF